MVNNAASGTSEKEATGRIGSTSLKDRLPLFLFHPEHRWRTHRGQREHWRVVVGDYIYGGADGSNRVLCIEMKTGEVKWEARGGGRNSTSAAAG